MSTTLTIDPAGGLFLPPELLQGARFRQGGKVEVDVTMDCVLVKPVVEESPVRLVQKGKLLVIEGLRSDTDVVSAIRAGRDERDARIARAVLGR